MKTLKLADFRPEEIGGGEPLFGECLGLNSIDGFELINAKRRSIQKSI